MIPYILAAVGGYLIGQSQKKDVPQMADGGEIRTLWLIRDNDAEMLMKGTPRSIKTFLNKEKKKSYRGEKSVYGNGSLEEWYQNTTKEEVLNHNRNYRSTDQSYADGGMMAKGGIFEVGDMVKVDDNGYVKLFSGFDISQPAKIISKEKGKAFGKVRYFYGLETADGKKPFNKAQESMLTKSAEKGGGMADAGKVKQIEFDGTKFYLTYIDPTHFFLSNSSDFKGNAYHIGQFKHRPFYNEVNEWLKTTSKSNMADGGEIIWRRGVTIELNTKKEAEKNAKQLAEYWGKSGKNFKVEKRGDGYVVTYDFYLTDKMAEGGVLAHGLREDDKIYVERGNLAGIKNDKTDEKFIVDISTGSREKLKD